MSVPINLRFVVEGQQEAIAAAKSVGDALTATSSQWASSVDATVDKITSTIDKIGRLGGAGFAANFAAGMEASLRQAEARARAIVGMASQVDSRGSGARPGAGGSATPQTGAMNRQLQQTTSLAAKMWQTIAGNGSPASQTLNTMLAPLRLIRGAVGAIDDAWTGVGNNLIRVSALFYSMERLGRLVEGATVGPIARIMNATGDERKFETSIAGVVGGMGNAQAINRSIEQIGPSSPLSLADLRQIGTEMSKVGPLAQQMAFTGPGGASSSIGGYANVIGQLQALNPERTTQEIAHGIGEALLGQGRALRTQVMIDPDQLAQMVGKGSSKDFRGNPDLLLQALQQYLRVYSPQGALDARQNLPEVQIQHLRDQFTVALEKIGDSGLFDQVMDRLKAAVNGLFEYVGSPEYQQHAQSISQSLGHLVDNIFDAAAKFLQGLTGAPQIEKSADGIVGGIDQLLKIVSQASDQLPSFTQRAGNAFQSLLHEIDYFMTRMEGYANHPLNAIGDAMVGDDNLRRANAIVADMRSMGLRGMQVTEQHAAPPANPSPWDMLAKGWYQGKDGQLRDALGNLVSEQVTGYNVDTSRMAGSQKQLADQILQQLQGTDTTDILKRGVRGVIGSSVDLSSLTSAGSTSGAAGSDSIRLISRQMVDSEDQIGTQLSLLNRSIDKLGGGEEGGKGTKDKVGELTEAATQAYESLTRTITPGAGSELKPGTMADIIRQELRQQVQTYNNRIAGLSSDGTGGTDFGINSILNGPMIAALESQRDKLVAAVQSQLEKMNQKIEQSIAKYGASVAMAVDAKSPAAAVDLMGRAISGSTDVANRAAADLGIPASQQAKVFGLAAMPPNMQPEVMRRYVQMQMGLIKEEGDVGGPLHIDQNTTADQLKLLAANGPMPSSPSLISSLAGRSNTAQMETQVYQQALEQASQQFENAKTAYANAPADDPAKLTEARSAMIAAGEEVANYAAKVRDAEQATNTALQSLVQFGDGVQRTLQSSFGNVFSSLIEGASNLRQVWQELAKSLINNFSQSASGELFGSLFGEPNGRSGAGNGMGGLIGAIFQGGAGAAASAANSNAGSNNGTSGTGGVSAGSAAGMTGGLIGAIMKLFQNGAGAAAAAANGAVWPGGFTPFASGGIATRPTLGLVGERPDRIPEAIIPMTHGGRIPLGTDGGSVFAMLPGGRRVPAGFAFAGGGIVAGGISFDRNLSNSAAASSLGSTSGGRSGGDTHVTIYTVTNQEEAIARGYSKIRGHVLNEINWAARPGGPLRRTLSKPN